MFSHQVFQTKEEFNKFEEINKSTKEIIKQKMEPNRCYPIIILTGMMGVGKSSLSCCLSNKSLIVNAKGKTKYLVGEGVGLGLNACTTIPSISFNSKDYFNVIDPPGFEDNRNYGQEIANSIAIDNLFEIFPNYNQNYKIVLVISCYDFKTNKCIKLIESFGRLKKMLPDFNSIKHTLGVVITKGDSDYEAQDYIDFYNEMISNTQYQTPEMKEVSQFLNSYKDNIFVFPQPTNNNIGQQYHFNDQEKLINFLKRNYVQNPKHQIVISENAESSLLLSYNDYLKNILNISKEICDKIKNQYQQEKTSANIKNWMNYIQSIKNSQIKKAKDFENVIRRYIPNSWVYNTNFQKLYEYQLFDELICKILPSHEDKEYLNEYIEKWCINANHDLSLNYANARTKEHEIYIQEQKRIEEEKREQLRKKQIENEARERKIREELEEARRMQEESNRMKEQLSRRFRVIGG